MLQCIKTAVALLILFGTHAQAQTVSDFYHERTVTLIVGNGPGGGFDTFARLVARYIGQYIPGHPSIVVENMPGAGSLVAANYLYNQAPRDGTVFGLIARDMPLIAALNVDKNVRFDPRRFTWIGSSSDFSNDAYVLIARREDSPKSILDLRNPEATPLLIGGTSEGGASSDVPRILSSVLGLQLRIIAGYRDSAAIYLAMESGEVAGRMSELSSIRSKRPAWLRET